MSAPTHDALIAPTERGAVAAANRRQAILARHLLQLARTEAWPEGTHLTEEALATRLGVSRSPVRSLLKQLADRRLVEFRPRLGCFLLVDGLQLPESLQVEQPAPVDRFYQALIEDQLHGRLPARFTTSELGKRYGLSRTTIDAALQRLSRDGLLHRNSGQGWSFPPSLDTAEARRASYDFRILLEPGGILLPTFAVDRTVLADLKRRHLLLLMEIEHDSLDHASVFDTDSIFHQAIAGFSGNDFVAQAMAHHNRLRHLLEYSTYNDRPRMRDWCLEHLAILSALETGAHDLASRLLRDHLATARKSVVDAC